MENEGDVKERFSKILKRACELGLTGDQLATLQSAKKLRAPKTAFLKRIKWLKPYILCLFGVVVVCQLLAFGVWLVEWPWSRYRLADIYFEHYGLDIKNERCFINVRDTILDLSRPPVDCAMCRGISSVDRVSNISPKEFEEKYAYSGRPVVVTDAMLNWTAPKVFSFTFFKSVYAENSPTLFNVEQNCQFFPYKTSFMSLGEVFNMSEERAQLKDGSEAWYIGWSNCDSSAANVLRQHYERPYFLPQVAESSKTDWIFMGSVGYGAHMHVYSRGTTEKAEVLRVFMGSVGCGAHMHIDNVGNPSWQAQVTGEKLWTLEPPPECYHQCKPQMDVTIHSGEIIVLDTNAWFHSTLVTSQDLSICIGSEFD